MSRRVKIGAALLLLALIAVAAVSAGRDLWADWHFRACETAVRAGDYALGQRHLDSCAKVWSSSWRCHLWRIRLARLSGRLDDASRLLLAAEVRQRDIPRELLSLEAQLLKAQQGLCDVNEETELRERVNQDHAEAPLCLHALSLGYLRLYRLYDAEDCLNLWLESQPHNIDALMHLGKAQERLSRFREATETYRKILRLKPDDRESLIRTANLLVLTNQIADAGDLIESCLQKYGNDPRVQFSAGVYRHQQGKVEEAIRLLDDLLKQEPRNVRGLLARGKIAVGQAEPELALPYFERALKAAPRDCQALFLAADCLIRSGRNDEGQKLQEQALRAQQDLARVGELTKTLQNRPNDADVRCEIGTLLVSFGDVGEGRLWIESALHFDPNHAGAKNALAQIQARPRN